MNDEPLTDGWTDGRTDTQNFGGYNIIPRLFKKGSCQLLAKVCARSTG